MCVPRGTEGLYLWQAARSCMGTLTALGNCSLCAGKDACLSLSCGKPSLFIFSPILSPDDPPWRCPSPDACSPSACSPVRQGDSLCKCPLVCSVRCCSVLLSPGTAALCPFLQLRVPWLLGLVHTEGLVWRAVPRAAGRGMRGCSLLATAEMASVNASWQRSCGADGFAQAQ